MGRDCATWKWQERTGIWCRGCLSSINCFLFTELYSALCFFRVHDRNVLRWNIPFMNLAILSSTVKKMCKILEWTSHDRNKENWKCVDFVLSGGIYCVDMRDLITNTQNCISANCPVYLISMPAFVKRKPVSNGRVQFACDSLNNRFCCIYWRLVLYSSGPWFITPRVGQKLL